MSDKEGLGIILTGATTREAKCQLLENAEKGKIKEGILILVQSKEKGKNPILARISQIKPHNAFYTEGDPWSEARRKGMDIPEGIARQYEICNLELLIELPSGEITYPPRPGDTITRIDPKAHEEDIFGVTRDKQGYSWYGSLSGYEDAPVPLDIEKIPMHMAVFGTTGSGKSYDTGSLIEKFMEIKASEKYSVSFPMVIIDANGDYSDYANYFKNKDDDDDHFRPVGWVKRFVFPHVTRNNPNLSREEPIGIDLDILSTQELSETIIMYYKGGLEGSEMQLHGIKTLFDTMKLEGANSIHNLFADPDKYEELLETLEKLTKSKKIPFQSKPSIIRAFEKFMEIEEKYHLLSTKSKLTDPLFIDEITTEGGIAILDFSEDGATSVEIQTKQLVMTYIASLLFTKFTKFKIEGGSRFLIFLVEEAQNFIPSQSYPIGSSLAKNKLSLIATQGRKFGLSLCLITQRPSFVDKIVLSMCNTFFIHRISPGDVSYVDSITGGLPSSIANRVTRLGQGELILTGQMNKVPFPLLLHIPGDRIVPHTAGTTNVIKTLVNLRRKY